MNIPVLAGLVEIADEYDLFIFDLWGVVHDGLTAYPGAIECLRALQLQDKKAVLLSNAPRPAESVTQHLLNLGIEKEMYNWLLTSGDATAAAFANIASNSSVGDGPLYFHLGPERNRPTLDACGGREVGLGAAEVIICTGLFDDNTEKAEDYRDFLMTAVSRGVPMICANPDIVVMRGRNMIQCAGAVAVFYEKLGGAVKRFGKPFPDIFNHVFTKFSNLSRSRSVMVGDALATDISGARQAGLDAIWIAGGIHAGVLLDEFTGELDPNAANRTAKIAGELPVAVMPYLKWLK